MADGVNIMRVPFENAYSGTVRTGPMQFGDDWPGIFLRGDAALGLAAELIMASRVLKEHWGKPADAKTSLDHHAAMLSQCAVKGDPYDG